MANIRASEGRLREQARGLFGGRGLLGLALALVLVLPLVGRAQTIDNTAMATYQFGAATVVEPSNTFSISTAVVRTDAGLELLSYAPGVPGATSTIVSSTECSPSGAATGPFIGAPGPTTLVGAPIPIGATDLLAAAQYALGEAAYLGLVDMDQNTSALAVETILVRLNASGTGDQVLLRLSESGPNTGEFNGWVQTSSAPAAAGDCLLSGGQNGTITAAYVDASDPTDTATDTAIVQPLSVVFDSSSGTPLSGVTIRLVDDATGLDASPLGDDGVSPFPATIVSGGTASDGVKTYIFDPGTYRYPYVPAGTYRLEVTPPAGYAHPSLTDTAMIQVLPGAPYSVVAGSRGGAFSVAMPGAIDIDLPLDPITNDLFLSITSNKEVVGIGDFLQYDVRVRNPGSTAAPTGMDLSVTVPVGFRYRTGTSTIEGAPVADPTITDDGRRLAYSLPPLALAAFVNVRLVAEVTTGAPIGHAVATAQSVIPASLESHTATHTVLVRGDLFSNSTFILGQIALGGCYGDNVDSLEGVPGVRVYLEDGTYAVTDERGLYHLEGIDPGVHVVQVDTATISPDLELVPCVQNTRFAGRNLSQFVDVQGGTLWRADFRLVRTPPDTGYVSHRMDSLADQGRLTYWLETYGSGVPVDKLNTVVMLPPGVRYIPGSSRLFDDPIDDPEMVDGALVYRFEPQEGRWSKGIEFTAVMDGAVSGPAVTKSYASFRTSRQKRQQTPLATLTSYPTSRSSSGPVSVETLGLQADRAAAEHTGTTEVETEAETPAYDKAWLERAGPDFEWLYPGPTDFPSNPSTRVLIKHSRRLRIELLLNGEPVSGYNFDGQITNSTRTVAISKWRGIDLENGPNLFKAIARDQNGVRIAVLEAPVHYSGSPVKAVLLRERSRLIADGRTPIVLAVRLTDRWGMPARQGVTGDFDLEGAYRSNQERKALEERQLAGLAPERPHYLVGPDGVALFELAPSTDSGRALLRIPLGTGRDAEISAWIRSEARDWVLVGLAEGTLAHQTFSGDEQALEALDYDDHWGLKQRTSLFAKGQIKGDLLLTIAYDSRDEESRIPESLKEQIDPASYYTLYGSGNEQGYEAPTSSKLYVKLEGERFYTLFGDYDTDLNATELSRYNRSFTGLKSEYQGERLSFSGFATETSQGFIREELRGDGTSGLYHLSRSSIIRNSEKIRIEVRDRFKTEQVLRSERQSRHIDYDIDYGRGTLFFRRPIPSKAEGFNPVFIVVEYESDDDRDESLILGGRAATRFLDGDLEIGASALHEGNTGQNGELLGTDLRYDISPTTRLRAEAAWSNTDELDVDRDGIAYLTELTTKTERVDARIYFREQEAEFGLGQQSGTETGTRKLGADGELRLTASVSLAAEAYRQTNLETRADRDVLQGKLQYQKSGTSVYGGFRRASDSRLNQGTELSQQLIAGASQTLLDERLRLRLDSELTLGGDDENVDYPARVTAGADFALHPRVTAFAEHEYSFGNVEDAHGSRAGLRSTPWNGASADASIVQRLNESGARTFANLGLSQGWQVTDRWSVEAALDRTATLHHPGRSQSFHDSVPPTSGTTDNDFTAISLGSTYRREGWSWATRLENRFGEQQDSWRIFSGLYHEFAEGMGYSVKLELSDADAEAADDATNGQLSLGFVYRPLGTRWILLNRTDFRFDERDGGEFEFRNRKLVENLNLNFMWSNRLQVSLQYGAKYNLDTVAGQNLDGFIDLWGIELRRDLGDKWDVGASVRLRRSWDSDITDSGYGVSVGYQMATNLWVSVGYNFAGFRDSDFSGANYTAKGPWLRFRYKFDQQTIMDILGLEP